MKALLRSVTILTTVALLLFVGLHAVIPHDHPGQSGFHGSEIPPIAHAENKLLVLLVLCIVLPLLATVFLRTIISITQSILLHPIKEISARDKAPNRYDAGLRTGRIHPRTH